MSVMRAMQMPVMKVTDMVTVFDGNVPAVGAVLMVVVFVDFVGHLFLSCSSE
jgi:hypothetical protein